MAMVTRQWLKLLFQSVGECRISTERIRAASIRLQLQTRTRQGQAQLTDNPGQEACWRIRMKAPASRVPIVFSYFEGEKKALKEHAGTICTDHGQYTSLRGPIPQYLLIRHLGRSGHIHTRKRSRLTNGRQWKTIRRRGLVKSARFQ